MGAESRDGVGGAGREVVHGDALGWLREHPAMPGVSVVTSLPDVSELGTTLERWRAFFLEAATLSLRATPEDGLTIFFQTDLKREGRWVSKSSLVLRAAEDADVPLLWHKIVCRRAVGQPVPGRPGYSHLLAFSRGIVDEPSRATADVLPDLGHMPWSHSMGTRAAEVAMRAIRTMAPATHTVVVPFCGIGTALSVANAHGLSAIGIEKNRKRAEQARVLEIAAEPG